MMLNFEDITKMRVALDKRVFAVLNRWQKEFPPKNPYENFDRWEVDFDGISFRGESTWNYGGHEEHHLWLSHECFDDIEVAVAKEQTKRAEVARKKQAHEDATRLAAAQKARITLEKAAAEAGMMLVPIEAQKDWV